MSIHKLCIHVNIEKAKHRQLRLVSLLKTKWPLNAELELIFIKNKKGNYMLEL
jgi:hypothetical protein